MKTNEQIQTKSNPVISDGAAELVEIENKILETFNWLDAHYIPALMQHKSLEICSSNEVLSHLEDSLREV